MNILGTIIGFVVALLSILGLWGLISMIISGAIEGNWLMVIAGGILAWLFIGLLFIGLVAGAMIMFLCLFDD